MTDFIALHGIAFKRERAASRRLARAYQLTADQALLRTLQASAGPAGLDALVAARLAAQAAEVAARQSRQLERDARQARPAPAVPAEAWQAWFDGSARPNPGRCAIGALLRGPGGAAFEIAEPAGRLPVQLVDDLLDVAADQRGEQRREARVAPHAIKHRLV